MIICTWRMGNSELMLILISSTWDCTTFRNFLSMLQKNFFKKKTFTCGKTNKQTKKKKRRKATQIFSCGVVELGYFRKLAGLWLACEILNHVEIYGLKVAEGFSAFQRRSYLIQIVQGNKAVNLNWSETGYHFGCHRTCWWHSTIKRGDGNIRISYIYGTGTWRI